MGFCNSVKKGYIATLCAFIYTGMAGCGEEHLIPTHRSIIISTDNSSCNQGLHEVDDGYALLYALNTQGVNVLAVTASHGNTTVDRAYECTKRLLKMAESEDIPVFKGARSKEELGEVNEAVLKMRDIVNEHPGSVWIVVTGTSTDLASFLMNYPESASLLAGVVLMAGVLYGAEGLPYKDIINVLGDMEVVDYVLSHAPNLKIAPLDLTADKDFVIDYRFLKNSINGTDYLPALFLFQQSEDWAKILTFQDGGFHPYDVVGLFAFFYPAQVTRKEFHRLSVFKDPFDPRYTDFKIVDNDTSRPVAEIWLDARRDFFWRTFKGALRMGN